MLQGKENGNRQRNWNKLEKLISRENLIWPKLYNPKYNIQAALTMQCDKIRNTIFSVPPIGVMDPQAYNRNCMKKDMHSKMLIFS